MHSNDTRKRRTEWKATGGLSDSIKDVYFPFQRSFIDLLGKSIYLEKILETRL